MLPADQARLRMPALREGQKFERYRIIRLLGRGVAGESYEAEDTALFRKVVLKLLQPWAPFSDGARRQFFREMQGLSLLNHRYLAPVLDYGEVHGNLYVARRFFSSGSLLSSDGRLWFSPPLELEAAITYAHQLAQALQHIHDSGYLHGAVGLANIMVLRGPNIEREPDYAPFLLADVGLASFVRRCGRPLSSVLPVTAAPEQIGKRVTPASDQFALAVLLYLWIGGRPPYLGSPAEVEQAKLAETFPSLMSLNPHVSLAQEGIIRRALSVYPEDRYPSILTFADALLATLKQRAVPTTAAPLAAPAVAASEATSEATAALPSVEEPEESSALPADERSPSSQEEAAGGLSQELQEPAPVAPPDLPAQVEDETAPVPASPSPVSETAGSEDQQAMVPLLADHGDGQEAALAAGAVSESARPAEEPVAGPTGVVEEGEPAANGGEAGQGEEAPATTYLETLLQAARATSAPLSLASQERVDNAPGTYDGQASVVAEGAGAETGQNGAPLSTGQLQTDEDRTGSQEVPPTSAIALLEALSNGREAQSVQTALPLPVREDPALAGTPETGPAREQLTSAAVTGPTPSACLLVIPPAAREPYVVPLALSELKIGRAGDSDLLLGDDLRVSRRHAYLRREGTHFLVQDGDNAEGVFINGRRLAPHASQILQEGDRILIGDYELIFYRDADQSG
jgi:serine/threonine protein kinase